MKDRNRDYLLEKMVDLGFVTDEQIARARINMGSSGKSVMDILLVMNFITPIQIAMAKGSQFSAQVVVLRDISKISQEIIALLTPALAWCYRVIPLEKEGRKVTIAVEDPSDLNGIDTLMHLLNADPLELRVVADDDMEDALNKYYPGGKEAGKKRLEQKMLIREGG